jgi:hypothetical protein
LDAADSRLILAFLACLAHLAFSSSAEAASISLSKASSKRIAHIVHSGEH